MEIGFMNQGMEFNTLFQQDADLGVNWSFEPIKNIEGVGLNQKDDFQQDFIVDGETGEPLPIPQKVDVKPVQNSEIGQEEFNFEDLFLQSGIPSDPSKDVQLIHSENTDTMGLLDDIAALSEAYLAYNSGECAKQEMATTPVQENVQFQQNQFQTDLFGSPHQMQMQEKQKPLRKDQFFDAAYPSFPTPPYSEQNDPQVVYSPPHMSYSPEHLKSYSPVGLEDVELTEMMATQRQNDLLAQLDDVTSMNVGNPPPINTEDVSSPGGWFLTPTEPTTNLTEFLEELDTMNNMSNRTGPYMDPPITPYVPPPIGAMKAVNQAVLESDSLDSGFSDNMMDIEMHEITHGDAAGLITIEPEQETAMAKKMRLRESRDEKKARELNISLTLDQIINTAVEEYNELLARANLDAAQQSLVRDIRRRGKNKVAAQNCRKRKIETISSMEYDIDELNVKRQELISKKKELEASKKNVQAKYNQLYQQIFSSLRDETGRPYDQSRFSLQQVEGAIILVPGKFGNSSVKKPESRSPVAFFDLSKVKVEKEDCITL